MNDLFARIRRWQWLQQVKKYPKLRAVPDDEAIQRLKLYTQAERAAMQPWLAIAYGVMVLCVIGMLAAFLYFPRFGVAPLIAFVGEFIVFGWSLVLTRRVAKRIKARIQADIEAGRALECIACGYDLRGDVHTRCPECGAEVGTVPTPETAASAPDPEAKLPPKGFGQWG